MAMVVSNWQDHPLVPGSGDVGGLAPINSTLGESVQSPPHPPNHSQGPKVLPNPETTGPLSSNLQIEPNVGPPPQSPSSSRNGSVSDGGSITQLGERPIQPPTSSPSSTGGEKPPIECVVSQIIPYQKQPYLL